MPDSPASPLTPGHPAARLAPLPFHAASGLTAAQLDVWRLDLFALQSFARALGVLVPRPVADRMSPPRLVARGALHVLLGAYLECRPERIHLQNGRYGKPSIDALASAGNGRDIRFNLAHTDPDAGGGDEAGEGAVALVAVAVGADVGVDVEGLRPLPRCLKIARRHFPPAAWERLAGLEAGRAQQREFLRLWSRHEAAAKARGTGVWRSTGRGEGGCAIQDVSWSEAGREYLAAVAVAETGADAGATGAPDPHPRTRELRCWRLP